MDKAIDSRVTGGTDTLMKIMLISGTKLGEILHANTLIRSQVVAVARTLCDEMPQGYCPPKGPFTFFPDEEVRRRITNPSAETPGLSSDELDTMRIRRERVLGFGSGLANGGDC
jgi:hypothetical protein